MPTKTPTKPKPKPDADRIKALETRNKSLEAKATALSSKIAKLESSGDGRKAASAIVRKAASASSGGLNAARKKSPLYLLRHVAMRSEFKALDAGGLKAVLKALGIKASTSPVTTHAALLDAGVTGVGLIIDEGGKRFGVAVLVSDGQSLAVASLDDDFLDPPTDGLVVWG